MRRKSWVGWYRPLVFVSLALLSGCGRGDVPRINERFPVKSGDELSPPIVDPPVHECGEAVHVTGFVPHALVKVYANGTEEVGSATPPFAFEDIHLTRPLKLGETVTATQTVSGKTSAHSIQLVTVSSYPVLANGFPKPIVNKDLYACGVIVPVGKLIPSVKVHVFEDAPEVGSAPVATEWVPVWTQALTAGRSVTAIQIACEEDSLKKITSPRSDPVTVKAAPNPVPSPAVDGGSLIVGNDAVLLSGLFVGSHVVVRLNGSDVGGGWTTADANWVPISQAIPSGASVTATQELCGVTSPPSEPVQPTGTLPAPHVDEPICAGARFVILRNTVVNATVVVRRNGAIVGYGGATGGIQVLALGDNVQLNTGDVITAQQYVGSTVSPGSNSVTVVASISHPAVDVVGGNPFFLAEAGEQQIDGAVFPRGVGTGPQILIHSCCSESARVEIRGPSGSIVAQPAATSIFPGYQRAAWEWTDDQGNSIGGGLSIGRYTVIVRSGCHQEDGRSAFYVIFNPDDVGGPARFSFNETCVWFGTKANATLALSYELHPDDRRVFSDAIAAATGTTDPRDAAPKVSRAEEAKFSYSLDYHTQDVLDLLENYDEAQCADDACLLTAMLRSIGIPAHPVTADADLETPPPANWTFDTWVEYLVPGSAGVEWLILHPHQYPNMNPEQRDVFGSTRSVAEKVFNDIIVMANENWIWSEVADNGSDATYGRTSCTEPNEIIQKKAWLGELCEAGYWSPSHWDCGGFSTRSGTASFELDTGDVGYGRSISGSLGTRRAGGSGEAPVTIRVVTDLPESKAFPDSSYDSLRATVRFDRRGEGTTPFRLRLPDSTPPGHDAYVAAWVGGRLVSVQRLRLPQQLRGELRGPRQVPTGRTFRLSSRVTNESKRVVSGLVVSLRLPRSIRTDGPLGIRRASLQPGESWDLQWNAAAIAPLEAGSVRLEVASANGGAVLFVAPIRVLGGTRGGDTAPPVRRR